jgi:hypothetical protein
MNRPVACLRALFPAFVGSFYLGTSTPAWGAPTADRTWALIPIVLVNPENGFGTGVKFLNRAWPGPDNSIDAHLLLTTRRQADLQVEQRHRHWFGSAWETCTQGSLAYFPESFFGAGNHPLDGDEQIYTPRGLALKEELRHPLCSAWFLRLTGEAAWKEMDAPKGVGGNPADSTVLGAGLPGYAGGFDDLWGAGVELDTRDDDRLPSRGWHAGHWTGHSLASGRYPYGAVETWVAAYAVPAEDWEAAAKVHQRTVTGDPPFYALPYLGDKRLLRGVLGKRLRDRSVQAAQVEVRRAFRLALPGVATFLGDTWQAAAFAGVGRVGHDFAAASAESPHLSGGLGGRLILGKRIGAIRGDVGFSEYGLGIYIDFNQAF